LREGTLSLEGGGGFDMFSDSSTFCEIALFQGPQGTSLAG
jgi:hypothetical protein